MAFLQGSCHGEIEEISEVMHVLLQSTRSFPEGVVSGKTAVRFQKIVYELK